MKYSFKNIKNGQICEGYLAIDINDHEAEITDDAAILLAEKHGGELVELYTSSKRRKSPLDVVEQPEPKQKLEEKPEITEE